MQNDDDDDDDDDVTVQDYHLPTTRYEGIDHLSIIKKRAYSIFFTITLTGFYYVSSMQKHTYQWIYFSSEWHEHHNISNSLYS